MVDGLLALQGSVVLEWRTLGMPVGIARRDVEGVQTAGLFDQERGHVYRSGRAR
jgi:hypothetical protein